RGGKTEDDALDNVLAFAKRYTHAVDVADTELGPLTRASLEIVERLKGNATTDFGAPGVVPDLDRAPVDEARLQELIGLLRATWDTFDKVAAGARGKVLGPSGPRGGGRTLDKMVAHVADAQAAYVNAIGGSWREGAPWADTKREFERLLPLRARGELPDVGPRGGKRWPATYAIRRSAWHALDHAWEIEDRLG
ncbi:MAG TPA: hypothetical protein VM284_06725, partial [Candidatus Limnocylindria bacterium]|nr:hypothetical protein [Candidatus Limnocylindria bacterium]